MAKLNKIDSNISGMRYAEEISLGVLPAAASQFWLPTEPNSFSDWGGQITTIARNPINPGRQRKKGVVTDMDAAGGVNQDITQTNLQDLLQGFFFADLRRKKEFTGSITVLASDDSYGATDIHLNSFAGDLILASGFTLAGNNGLKIVATATGNKITVSTGLTDEGPTAGAKIVTVGFQFSAGDAEIDATGSLPALVSTTKNLTQLGLVAGEWVFIGGDAADTQFAQAANNGFARVRSIATNRIEFDKTQGTMVTDDGATKTIRLFKGRVLKNEIGSLIKRRSYHLERPLGANDDADLSLEQAEYLKGAIPSELTLNISMADKVTVDLSFTALDHFTLDENDSVVLLSKAAVAAGSAANAPSVVEADAFNTSSDVSRMRLSTFSLGSTNPIPLFAFVQDITLSINNNLTPNKAVGVLGAFEVTAGTFEVGGNITAYFADVAAIKAVRDNADVTLDLHLVKSNAGMSWDVPLITLGDGRANVEQDQPITLPLETMAAAGGKVNPAADHTLLIVFYDYLPNLADM